MERLNKIKQKLADIGENYDNLKPFMQDYLNKIEIFIESKEKAQNKAVEILKSTLYNVSDVSKELGCSRTTLYNHNQLLKRYIEASIAIFNKGNPYISCDKLKESKQKLQEQVNLMENRDIYLEIQKYERKILTDKISDQNIEIELLRSKVNKLSAELHEFQKNWYTYLTLFISRRKAYIYGNSQRCILFFIHILLIILIFNHSRSEHS